jgi:esterase
MSQIHYQIQSNNSQQPWVMLIHGLFGNLDNLSGLRRQLSDDYQVLSVDLPDHGKSSYSAKFSFNDYAKKLIAVIEELGIEQIALIGHSLGGKVAMQMAVNHSDNISKLVVIDIAPVAYPPRHNNVIEGLNNINLTKITKRSAADLALQPYIEEASTRMFLLKGLYQDHGQFKWRFNLPLLERDYSLLSAAINISNPYDKPALFIKGEHSDYIQLAHKKSILAAFPKAQSKVISNTGHWLHAEKPELCGKIITKFLTS